MTVDSTELDDVCAEAQTCLLQSVVNLRGEEDVIVSQMLNAI